jgi:uncharacterized lipoprotein YddW (UPF0748 family)
MFCDPSSSRLHLLQPGSVPRTAGVTGILCFLLLAVAGVSTTASAQSDRVVRNQQTESRVLFDEDMAWATSRDATDRILDRVKRAGFNVYVPCIWHGHGTYYPSPVAPADPALQGRIASGDDPLAYLLDQAHRIGIQVTPWFTVVRREGGLFPQWRSEGTNESAFNVHDPGFRRFAVDLMMDVVRRYAIDGINLDYIRSMGICRSEGCKADYAARFGRDLERDLWLRKLPLPARDSIATWNAEDVTAIVREFAETAKAFKPSLVISVDAHPLHPDLTIQGQDAIEWANRAWVDVIYNMDYGKEVDLDRMRRTRAALKDPNRVILLTALFDLVNKTVVPRRPDMIAGYVTLTRRLWPGSGIAFYHFKQLTDAQLDALREGPFMRPAVPEWTVGVKTP